MNKWKRIYAPYLPKSISKIKIDFNLLNNKENEIYNKEIFNGSNSRPFYKPVKHQGYLYITYGLDERDAATFGLLVSGTELWVKSLLPINYKEDV